TLGPSDLLIQYHNSYPISPIPRLKRVPVTRLPDLCLLAIFRQMTLGDQIRARNVCRRWADLMFEATINRRKLILLIGGSKNFEERIGRALFFYRQTQNLLLNDDGSKKCPI